MHKPNIIISGPESFIQTFSELKSYLKFNLNTNQKNLTKKDIDNFDAFILFEHDIENTNLKELVIPSNCIKILATTKINAHLKEYDFFLKLPTSIKEINNLIESSVAKRKFNKNSSIKIKSYLLNKNEKKLIKENKFAILTEKEIHLLELFLTKSEPVSKNNILSLVWNYSSDADTHTVETHIYRLRKKISDKFSDQEFILNNKDGYYL